MHLDLLGPNSARAVSGYPGAGSRTHPAIARHHLTPQGRRVASTVNPPGLAGWIPDGRSQVAGTALLGIVCLLGLCSLGIAQIPPTQPPERMQQLRGNFIGHTARPLRYLPDGHDFVISNGAEFFNRPLYGGNTAFRVDGGDRPEFSLYLPGRGGNLRFGVRTPLGVKWFHEAEHITTRYRPGSLLYEIRDPMLEGGRIEMAAIGLYDTEGMIARIAVVDAAAPLQVFWAFGGADGMRGRRGGDIGCEREPVGVFFQLRPEQCQHDEIEVSGNAFVLTARGRSIHGMASEGAEHGMAPAHLWPAAGTLFESVGATTPELPLVVGQTACRDGEPVYLALQSQAEDSRRLRAPELEGAFAAAEARRRQIAERVQVRTPDLFVNAAAAALNVAADAVWDEPQASFMHGAVAWRTRLLGWRGLYAGDSLGWHERTRMHLAGYAREQNTEPIPARIPRPEASANLSRNENALHSNGNMTRKHYDMNLVAVDAFFRHLLWTDDLEFARQYWPVLKRHLDWERRLFRREYGADQLPLYEGYACFWASDDVAYNGGGSAVGSAYNHYHNRMAARLARILGEDPAPYEKEAQEIKRAMTRELWLPEQGWFGEFKDWLGLRQIHPSPGLWSIYHTIDSGIPTPLQAWRMSRFVETELPHIPVSGPNVPPGCFTLPTSTWMPYNWSVNNVVMAEATHTALACWQANRRDLAFPLFKGALLDSMFLGLCPGNVGMCTDFDAYRHESQRDFADGVGATSRALVEGLFGIRPDALAAQLTLCPGFPAEWNHAGLRHPDVSFEFQRQGASERYRVEQAFRSPMKLRFQIIAAGSGIEAVSANGEPVEWQWMESLFGERRVEIETKAAARMELTVTWSGRQPGSVAPPGERHNAHPEPATTPAPQKAAATPGPFEPIDLRSAFNDRVAQIFRNEYLSPRSPFCSLATPKQGIGSWCLPHTTFEVDDSGLRALAAKGGGEFRLPTGVPLRTPTDPAAANVAFVSQWDNYPVTISVPLGGRSSRAYLLMAGSTGPMQSRLDNGEIAVIYRDGSTERLALHNPTTWWPIDQDYFIDDYAFRYNGPLPIRVDLGTGKIRVLEPESFNGQGGKIPGGAATVLELPLDPDKELRSLSVRALANEVVIGLMSLTLAR